MAKENIEKEVVQPVDNSVDKKATMEVPVDNMQAVMDRLAELEKSNAALRETVSSTRLQEAEDKQGEDKRARVHFKLLDGKAVIGWPETVGEEKKNEIIFNPTSNTPVGELVKSVYYLHDGTKTDLIDQIKFIRASGQVYARVIKDEGEYGVVEFEDKSISSEPIKIHKKFWNA